MTFRKSILLLMSLSMIAALVACGGSSSTTIITPPPPPPVTGPLPDGNYVFSLIGDDDTGQYSLAGAFTVSQGSITTGEQDFVDFPNTAYSDQINPTGSSITASSDGNLIITLATCLATDCTQNDTKVGVTGIETLDASVLPNNAAKAFITEYDSSASSSGELDLQTSAVLPTLPVGYAFMITGLDSAQCQTSLGGVINITSATAISGANSVFDVNDCGGTPAPAVLLSDQSFNASTSTISGPDTSGRLVFSLVPSATLAQINLVGYIVSPNQIDLVETTDGNVNFGTTSGIAFNQTNPGQFTTASASGNTYVAGLNGGDVNGVLKAATQITTNADGSVSGFIDFNDLSTAEPASPDPVSAPATAYTVDPTGRVTITGLSDSATPPNVFDIELYLDGNGHALALTLDNANVLVGIGYQQSGAGSFAATSFNGSYAMGATGWDVNGFGELDAVGPVTATGSSGTFSGDVDLNWLQSPGPVYPNAPVSGTFAPSSNATAAADGIFTGTITGVDVTTCTLFTTTSTGNCTADIFNYYLIDATGDNIAIETDFNQLTLGAFAQQ
jgi:hypothetical protein